MMSVPVFLAATDDFSKGSYQSEVTLPTAIFAIGRSGNDFSKKRKAPAVVWTTGAYAEWRWNGGRRIFH